MYNIHKHMHAATTTTPAPPPPATQPPSKCPAAPAPWEAWWDEEFLLCYCWNPLTGVTTWDCPKLPAPPPSPAARPTTTPRPGTQFTCFTSTKVEYCCATCGKLLRQLRR